MSELIYELSDSELDAIAGGQVNVVGNFSISVTSTTTSSASVSNSINSTASSYGIRLISAAAAAVLGGSRAVAPNQLAGSGIRRHFHHHYHYRVGL